MTIEVEALHMLLRQNLYDFIEKSFETVNPGQKFLANWHIEAIAWQLEQCIRGDIKRLIIEMPPRHLKSHCASVALPAWVLGRDPTRRVICASYSEELASFVSRQTREILTASWYRKVFPSTRLSRKKNTETEVAMTKGGASYGEQTEEILQQIDGLLAKAGTDKSKLIRATIWITDMGRFDEMNEVWDAWVAPGNAPARACVESKLAFPRFDVEIMVEAAV